MTGFVNDFATFQEIGFQLNENPGVLYWYLADILPNITNCEI
jgi:hypothetical protein